MPLALHLFRSWELTRDSLLLPRTRTHKEQWLLALLALRSNQEIERSWLAGTLWPDSEPKSALANLRRSLTNLRDVLGPDEVLLLSPTPRTLRLDVAGIEIDVLRFDMAIEQGNLEAAVALYRGALLEECDEVWVTQERQVREERYYVAAERLAYNAFTHHAPERAEELLRQLLIFDPLRETAQCALMETLAARGDFASATQVYRDFKLLLHEMKSIPSAETTNLHEKIKTQAQIPAQFFSAVIARQLSPEQIPEKRGNLPLWQEPIGREKQLENILKTLGSEQSRLTILTGCGGIGKTRLAVALGQRVKSAFDGRVWLINLLLITKPEEIEYIIRRELRLHDYEDLVGSLGAEPMLLILDNCEHLLEASAQLMKRLLNSCPQLHIIATSREDFWIIDNQMRYEVKGLDDVDAIKLFVQRFQAKGDSLKVEDKSIILEICHRLDNIPLEIELATAYSPSMTPLEIQTGLQNRLKFLTKNYDSAVPKRQESAASNIDWSYNLLNKEEQGLFCRLSVFKGGWTADAARAICAEGGADVFHILGLLLELTNKSLVIHEGASNSRYRMLETLREYAAAKITKQENNHLQKEHRNYFLARVEEAEKHLERQENAYWLQQLDEEYPNLIAALDWSLEENASQESLRFCGALQGYWGRRNSLSEGLEWCGRALKKAEFLEPTQELAKVCNAAGGLYYYQNDFINARRLYTKSLFLREQMNDQAGIADSRNNLGLIDYDLGSYDSALNNFNECLNIRSMSNNSIAIAYTHINIGMVYHAQGDYVSAQQHYNDSHSLFDPPENPEAKNPEGMAYVNTNRGFMALIQKNYAEAKMFLEQSQTIFTATKDQRSLAEVYNGLGLVALAQGEDYYPIAWDHLEKSLTIRMETGEKKGIAESFEAFACLAALQNQLERADRLWKAATLLRQEINVPLLPNKQKEYETVIGQIIFENARIDEQPMILVQAIKYAITNPNP